MRRIRTSHSLNDQFIEMSNLTQDELNRIAKHEIIKKCVAHIVSENLISIEREHKGDHEIFEAEFYILKGDEFKLLMHYFDMLVRSIPYGSKNEMFDHYLREIKQLIGS